MQDASKAGRGVNSGNLGAYCISGARRVEMRAQKTQAEMACVSGSKSSGRVVLPALAAVVAGFGKSALLWREVRVSPPGIQPFFAVVHWAIGELPRGHGESGDLIHAVASANDHTLDAFDKEIGCGGDCAFRGVGALPDVEGLMGSVKDVANAAAEFPAPVIVMARRGLDVSKGHTANGEGGDEEENGAVFHSRMRDLANLGQFWQERSLLFFKNVAWGLPFSGAAFFSQAL